MMAVSLKVHGRFNHQHSELLVLALEISNELLIVLVSQELRASQLYYKATVGVALANASQTESQGHVFSHEFSFSGPELGRLSFSAGEAGGCHYAHDITGKSLET